jgi:hypothetical protein
MYNTPPPDELEPKFNPATEQAADIDSPVDESFNDIPMAIDFPEPSFNPATEDAATEDEQLADE